MQNGVKMDKETVEICYRDKAANDAIVAWDAGMSKEEVSAMLEKHPTWYRSSTCSTEHYR